MVDPTFAWEFPTSWYGLAPPADTKPADYQEQARKLLDRVIDELLGPERPVEIRPRRSARSASTASSTPRVPWSSCAAPATTRHELAYQETTLAPWPGPRETLRFTESSGSCVRLGAR